MARGGPAADLFLAFELMVNAMNEPNNIARPSRANNRLQPLVLFVVLAGMAGCGGVHCYDESQVPAITVGEQGNRI